MTPQEKAKELVSKFSKDAIRDYKCALIAVDLILQSFSGFEDNIWFNSKNKFYNEVKQEIEKL
jgi:hypothetical protein